MAISDVQTVSNLKFTGAPFVEELTHDAWNDTEEVLSSTFDKQKVGHVIVLAENSAATANATLKVYGKIERDSTTKFDLSKSITANAGANAYVVITEPWPYLVIGITPTAAPGTGEDIAVFVIDGAGENRTA